MEIKNVNPTNIWFRPKKYAREIYGILVGEDNENYYCLRSNENELYKINKSKPENFRIERVCYGDVYVISNDFNNKIYIGKTENGLENRYYNHLLCCKNGKNKNPIYEEMREHGTNHFKVEKILSIVASNSYTIEEVENLFIKSLKSQYPNGYNIKAPNPYSNYFKNNWREVRSIEINTDGEYAEIAKKIVDENFSLYKWNKYKNFDFSKAVYKKEDVSDYVSIEIKRKNTASNKSSKKVNFKYIFEDKNNEIVKHLILEEFKIKLDEILENQIG